MSCVKSSQGFDWNQGKFQQGIRSSFDGRHSSSNLPGTKRLSDHISSRPTELFLPSYADYESQDLERKQDPVQDIVLTEEEIAAMFPQ